MNIDNCKKIDLYIEYKGASAERLGKALFGGKTLYNALSDAIGVEKMHDIEVEIIGVHDARNEDKQWIITRRLDNYDIIIVIKDGCDNYTIMDLTDREKLLLVILDEQLNKNNVIYSKVIDALTNKIIGEEKSITPELKIQGLVNFEDLSSS